MEGEHVKTLKNKNYETWQEKRQASKRIGIKLQ